MSEDRFVHALSLLRDIREAFETIAEDARTIAELVHNVAE